MPKDITSVYVPVKTPDHKVMAILAAVLVHIGVLGFIIYTNHTKPINEPPMQMSLVTPEQLAMIQGQAAANQQAQAAQVASNATANSPTTATNPAMASVNNDLAARQAKWQRDQAAYAAQLDKQAMQDQQNFNNRIKQVQMDQTAELNKLKDIQANPEAPQPLTQASKANKTPPTVKWKTDGSGRETGETSQTSPAGGGTAQGKQGSNAGEYLNEIKSMIESHWSPPHNSSGKSLMVKFDISPSGEISNVHIDGAGDEAFKSSLIQAVNSSSPVRPPPSDIYSQFASNRFTFKAN